MDLDSRYELLETIGTGSFATVYRARDRELGREVAIKQIHEQFLHDPEQLDRYWQEAQLLASLQHPNIVTIYDIHRDRGWLILELMQANLADRLAGRQMDLKSLKTTLAHCLRALKYLHARGVIHGDIKPGNIMLDHRKRVKLGDFGLARRASNEEGSLLKGATKYMAPEVVSEEFGNVGPASDLYSLGFTAYELMCGSENFEQLFPGLSAFGRNKQVAWMMWHAARDRRLPEIRRVLQGVPEDLTRVIQKLVEKDQSKRYRSADEALADLNLDQKIVRDAGGAVVDDGEDRAAADDPGRKRRLLLAGGGFAASFLLCLVMLFLPGDGGGPETPNDGGGSSVAVVRGVDAENGVIELASVDEGKPLDDLKLGPQDAVFLETAGRYVKLGELQSGDRITWERDKSGRVKIEAHRPARREGVVRAVDPESRTIEMLAEDERGNKSGLRLRVPPRATVLVNGRAVNDPETHLHEIEVRDRIAVLYLPEPGEKTGHVAERLEVRRPQTRSGFVVDVDAVGKTLTVRLGRDALADQISLPMAADVEIVREEEPVALADLKPEDAVRVEYDVEFHRIEVLEASGPIASLDYDERTVEINTDDGSRTIAAAENCEVLIAGEPASFADLRRSDEIAAKLLDGDGGTPQAARLVVRRPARRDRMAVLVAVERTGDSSLPRIPHAVPDVRELQSVLQTRYAVPEERVVVLLNRTPEELRRDIGRSLSEAGRDSEVIVYVIGHGYLTEEGEPLLAGPRFEPDRAGETGYRLDDLAEALDSSPAERKLLLLDLTHAAAERQPATAELAEALKPATRDFDIIASCAAGQRGLDWEDEQSGLFAHYLAAGYRGPADDNRDLHMTQEELFDWIESKMSAIQDGRQTPVLFEAAD